MTIDKGSSAGVERNDPVVNGDGLVGRITETTRGTAQVTLITDHDNAVSAQVLAVTARPGSSSRRSATPRTCCSTSSTTTKTIQENQTLVTAGWSNGRISSRLPAGDPDRAGQRGRGGEQERFQRIHVTPFADLRELEYVQVLTGGPERPGCPDDRHPRIAPADRARS